MDPALLICTQLGISISVYFLPSKLLSQCSLEPAQWPHLDMLHDEHPSFTSGMLNHLKKRL